MEQTYADKRLVGVGEVLWTYLAHKVRFAVLNDPERRRITADKTLLAGLQLHSDHPPYDLSAVLVRMQDLTDTARGIAGYHRWCQRTLAPRETGEVIAQLPTGKRGPIKELITLWQEWLQESSEEAVRDAKGYDALLSHLHNGALLLPSIISGPTACPRIWDGKHRLFATYQLGLDVTVFWGV